MITQRRSFILLPAMFLLAVVLLAACRSTPTSQPPNINDVVATGMAGTQHAWMLGTMVAATQSALSGQPQTPAPQASAPTAPPAPPAGPIAGDPCTGTGPGMRSYKDEREGYCLFYPENFFVNKPPGGGVEFLGPALDDGSPPLRAYINIARKDRVNGRTLDELAQSVWKGARSAYHISNIQLGGQDALIADDLLIGEADWKVKQVLFTHQGYVYLLSLSPVDSTQPFDAALTDIQRFLDVAIPSFTFR